MLGCYDKYVGLKQNLSGISGLTGSSPVVFFNYTNGMQVRLIVRLFAYEFQPVGFLVQSCPSIRQETPPALRGLDYM